MDAEKMKQLIAQAIHDEALPEELGKPPLHGDVIEADFIFRRLSPHVELAEARARLDEHKRGCSVCDMAPQYCHRCEELSQTLAELEAKAKPPVREGG